MSESAPPYLFEVAPRRVEVWAGYQIQFDGMRRFAWQNELVRQLKAALALMSLGDGEGLSGFYACTVPTRCDAENRLFTNPGAATFPAATTAIRWERATEVPPPPSAITPLDALHYYRYAPTTSFELWQPATVLVRWRDVRRNLPHDGSARPTWLALRQALVAGTVDILGAPLPMGRPFGIRLEVRAPARGPRSAPAISEALVDGVLCALHEGVATTEAGPVAQALHARLGTTPLDHLTTLVAQRAAILPGSPFKISPTGVQLSPLDEYCDAGEVTIRRDSTVTVPHLNGELFTLVQAPQRS